MIPQIKIIKITLQTSKNKNNNFSQKIIIVKQYNQTQTFEDLVLADWRTFKTKERRSIPSV